MYTLLFYYKDIKQEIVHTLLLKEYGVLKKWVITMDSKQDSNAASTLAETSDLRVRIVTVPGVQEEVQKNGVETEKNRDKSSNCDVYVTFDDVRCFL